MINAAFRVFNTAGFTPIQLSSTLAGWWKADAGITIATGVSAWADQSGNGNTLTQGTGSLQPAFSAAGGPGGIPTVTGDNIDDYLSAAFALPAIGSVYLLMKQTTWGAAKSFFGGNAVNTFLIRDALLGATPQIETYNAPAGGFIGPNGNLALATWAVVTAIFNGASSKIQVNLGAGVTGTAGNTAPNGITLFATPGGFNSSNCSISEVIVRNVADSTGVQEEHIRYLARRGGVSL